MRNATFNGKVLSEFGFYLADSNFMDGAAKNVETIYVPGRSGLLQRFNNYENIKLWTNVYCLSNTQQNMAALRAFLESSIGYQRYEDDFNPLQYRMASFKEMFTPGAADPNAGVVKLVFDAMPQRYLKSGDTLVTVSASDTLTNPTLFKSYPLLRTVGSGQIQIGNVTITVAESSYAHIYIDCETMNAYYGAHNANQYVSFSTHDRIALNPGDNGITHTLSELRVKPRWYEI